MRRSFLSGFGTNLSREYIKRRLLLTRMTCPSSRSSRSIVVIFKASRRAIERFFKMW
jgi:hypothetical protein